MADTQEAKKSRFDRKTVLVGLMVVLLFVGGGIYAWQDSLLKSSIGRAVQDVPFDADKEDSENPDIQPTGEIQETGLTPSAVQRTNKEIVRVQKQFIQVVTPNGGETFCLGDTFDILWRSQHTNNVVVILQGDERRYYFGVVSASGTVSAKNITLPAAGVYRVEVRSKSQPAVHDSSDAFFAIRDCAE